MNKTCFGLSVVVLLALPTACGSDDGGDSGGTGGASSGGSSSGGASSGGSSSGGASGASGSGGSGTGGSGTGGSGTGGSGTGGSGTGGSGTGGSGTGGSGTGGSGTGGSGTGGSGTGGSGSGGTGGSGSVTCSDLAKSYATALAAAKTCNPFLSVLQCTKSVSDELPCPCPTFVNPSNSSEMTQLTDLQTAWLKNKCNVGVICPAVACPQPSGATCSQSSGSKAGTCKDTIN
jgi:PPE-repeat protein